MMKIFLSVGLFLGLEFSVHAQQDLLASIETEMKEPIQYAEATFKGSRLINGHSIITRKRSSLEFLISHRFGRINSGAYEFFGLDGANVRFGLEYALTNQFTLGIGRNSFQKTYDGFVKYAMARQHNGERNFPVSVTWFSSMAVKTLKQTEPAYDNSFSSKTAYSHLILVARKFGPSISFQIMPTLIHRNEVNDLEKNDVYALGAGGRVKLSKRLSLNMEYYYRFNTTEFDPYHNSIAIGVDIETGGHVFQLHLTNSQAMIEKGFVAETTGDFFDGDIHFGFNISRVF